MIYIKLAFMNLIKHKLSTIVLITIFAMSTFILFWGFGFTNYLIHSFKKTNIDSYGDITFLTKFYSRDLVGKLTEIEGCKKIIAERELKVMVDGNNKSTLANIVELTHDNSERFLHHLNAVEGVLPQKPNEIAVTNFFKNMKYQIGDTIYLTTSTPEKIINTMKYTVVGILRGTAMKAMGVAYLVNEESMNQLINSTTQANLLYIYLDEKLRNEEDQLVVYQKIKDILVASNINITDSWLALQRSKKFKVFSKIFTGIKLLMIILMFPLLGAVIGAIVWIYSYKRRNEIWSYVAMGLKDLKIEVLFITEYCFIALIGMVIGFCLGYLSLGIAIWKDIWLVFSYTFSYPLRVDFGITEFIIIFIFIICIVTLWAIKPLGTIVKAVPYSY